MDEFYGVDHKDRVEFSFLGFNFESQAVITF